MAVKRGSLTSLFIMPSVFENPVLEWFNNKMIAQVMATSVETEYGYI